MHLYFLQNKMSQDFLCYRPVTHLWHTLHHECITHEEWKYLTIFCEVDAELLLNLCCNCLVHEGQGINILMWSYQNIAMTWIQSHLCSRAVQNLCQGPFPWYCVMTMTPDQPCTTLSDRIHMFTTRSIVCGSVSQLSLFTSYCHRLVSTLSGLSSLTIT